ncbi:DUF4328 domain-containing protein [Promicromonospora panici]|uniref:DUF4328 domain-containing protein n=1 Tax=Promicromonospora panici TaxID=2219658 RepID=UPI00101CB720|nr:DUF4328 domain-containing protein [Promicromonospora panici]
MTQPYDPYAPPPEGIPQYGAPAPSTTPQYDAYQAAYLARALRVPERLAVAVIVLSSAYLAVQVVSMLLSFDAAEAYGAATDPGQVYTAYDAVGIVYVMVLVAIFVVGCLWLNECRKFAVAVNPTYHHARSTAWVWLGWVVPVVALWFPYQVVRDLRRSTIREASGIGLWWGAWLGANFMSNQTALVTLGFRDASTLPVIEMVATGLFVIAFIGWLRIVRELTAAQRAHVAAGRNQVPGQYA